MAIPDFLAYAERSPASPFASAISSGLGAYQSMSKLGQESQKLEEIKKLGEMKRLEQNRRLEESKIKADALDIKNPLHLYSEARRRYAINPNDKTVPILRQLSANILAPKKGISVTTTPAGGAQVQIGGQQQGLPPELQQLQAIPGTKAGRGEKGGTFRDPVTGELISTPTLSETTQLQQSILGEKQVTRAMEGAQGVLAQMKDAGINYFSPLTHALAATSGFGGKYLFSQAAAAKSGILAAKGFVTKAAEKYMATSKMPRISATFKKVQDILMPDPGETSETYKARVSQQLSGLEQDTLDRMKALKRGVSVGKGNPLRSIEHRAPKGFDEFWQFGERVPVPPKEATPQYSQADLEYTAMVNNLTVAQVKKKLGAQ